MKFASKNLFAGLLTTIVIVVGSMIPFISIGVIGWGLLGAVLSAIFIK